MLVYYHKGFIMEGEATFTEKKHFWSKTVETREKVYLTTGIEGVCDELELDKEIERQIYKSLQQDGWGKDFSGWQRVLSYDESVEISKRNNWSNKYVEYHLPTTEVTTKTLDDWTVEKAAKELNGKQFAQYCRDYGIVIQV